MVGLHSKDLGSIAKHSGVGDKGSSALICGHTNILEEEGTCTSIVVLSISNPNSQSCCRQLQLHSCTGMPDDAQLSASLHRGYGRASQPTIPSSGNVKSRRDIGPTKLVRSE